MYQPTVFVGKLEIKCSIFFSLVFQILSLDLDFPHSRTPRLGQLLSSKFCLWTWIPSFQNPKARAVIILYILSPNEILLSCNTLIVLLKYITLAVNILWTNSSALTSLDLSALDSQPLDLQFFFRTHDIVLPFCICFVKNSSFCNVQYNFG